MRHMRTVGGYLICVALALVVLVGCSGSRSPILGTGGGAALRPTVTAVVPLDGATGVSTGTTVTATFNTPVSPLTGTAGFVVTCVSPCVNPTGTVTLDATDTVATFTLTPATTLQPSTLYTATVTGAAAVSGGLVLAAPFVWQFTTSIPGDTTRPTVTSTVPATTIPGPTATPSNTAIVAYFSKDMAPATIIAANFTVTCAAPCVNPPGAVSYDVANKSAAFTPTAALTVGDTYQATITPAATDLAGNALLGNQLLPTPATSDYVWSFIAGAAATAGPVTVSPTHPTAGQSGVCPNAGVNATFTVPSGLCMNPTTVNATTFTVTGPAPASTPVAAASVVLDVATGTLATFTPKVPFTAGVTYTVTIMGGSAGVKDLAVPADAMVGNVTWVFTAGPATASCLAPVSLGSAAAYGDFGGTAGMTNTGTLTVIHGDTGTIATGTSAVTGFHDPAGDVYTETPANIGLVSGTIFTCTNSTTGPNHAAPNAPNCSAATQARLDAQTAYLALKAMPPVGTPVAANLAGLTVPPGVYVAPGGSFLIQGGDLTLNAGGDANAVWVFQMATSLTVGGPGAAAPQSIILAGGAQAKNVYWQVGSAATINAGGGGTMVGTIISQAGAAFSTVGNTIITTLNGRALSLGASVTLVDTVINVPAP